MTDYEQKQRKAKEKAYAH